MGAIGALSIRASARRSFASTTLNGRSLVGRAVVQIPAGGRVGDAVAIIRGFGIESACCSEAPTVGWLR